MGRRERRAVQRELQLLAERLETLIEETRESAGFDACELLENETRQDAREIRETAIKKLAKASALVEVREMVQERIPCLVDPVEHVAIHREAVNEFLRKSRPGGEK